ncbi:MAG: M28 family metallopeptidase, partial [Chloroflexota bacterium]|nr:M28 family metallopeptidase [Chloroflexota bacterium]
VTPDKNLSRCAVEGWLTDQEAGQLFARSGHDLESLKQSAVTRDFTPVPLNVKASLSLHNELRTIDSSNLLAKLEGSDPDLKDEYVIYMGHWDHLGKNEGLDGDQIYNGAVDNATGIASLLELARAFSRLETRPRRSLLFLATTAEESGLLGSRYYSENPLYPLARTLAAINMDAMNVLGPTQDITVVGLGNSTLDEILQEAAQIQSRTVRPDPEPEKGFFYRSDHFSLAKQGIPSLYTDPGVDYIDKPADWGLKLREEYTNNRYHKPADEYDPSWDLSGLVEDLRLLFRVGYQITNQDTYPEWKSGTEFRALREQQLNAAR